MVLDENEHFLVLNKPETESVNDDDSSPGLISKLQEAFSHKLYPVHRLDKHTSGLLLVAKTAEANQALSLAFQNKLIEKRYLAITSTKAGVSPKKKQGWIKGDMEKARNGSFKLCSSTKAPAETYFKSMGLGDRKRLCGIRPITGKTHQIRVAMKALSMPILGDIRYGGLSADRMYLHALSLDFELFNKPYHYFFQPETGAFFNGVDLNKIKSLF